MDKEKLYSVILGWDGIRWSDKDNFLNLSHEDIQPEERGEIVLHHQTKILLNAIYIKERLEQQDRFEECKIVKHFIDDLIKYHKPYNETLEKTRRHFNKNKNQITNFTK